MNASQWDAVIDVLMVITATVGLVMLGNIERSKFRGRILLLALLVLVPVPQLYIWKTRSRGELESGPTGTENSDVLFWDWSLSCDYLPNRCKRRKKYPPCQMRWYFTLFYFAGFIGGSASDTFCNDHFCSGSDAFHSFLSFHPVLWYTVCRYQMSDCVRWQVSGYILDFWKPVGGKRYRDLPVADKQQLPGTQ